MISGVLTDPENPVMMHIGSRERGISQFLLCPDPEIIRESRRFLVSSDFDDLARVIDGKGCFIATDGWGWLHEVHRGNVASVRFEWLAGIDVDSMTEERLESTGRIYWAHLHQLSITHGAGQESRIEDLIRYAFR